MLNYIKGKILYKIDNGVVVNNNDIGYQIFITEKRLINFHDGQEVEFYTHEYLRENARELYGFEQLAELELFLQLIDISGIGPRLALKLFSMGSLDKLRKAIEEENALLLSTVPGVGKKTAQKIILELRGKLSSSFGLRDADRDVVEALENLGYKPNRARDVLKELPESATTSEEKIRAALKLLGKNKTVGI